MTRWMGRAMAAALAAGVVSAAELQVALPLGRTAYQTNERMDLAVVRRSAEALPAGVLTLTLAGPEGSRCTLAFPVPAVPVVGGSACATEHIRLDARLLRPGTYAVSVAADGANAETRIEVFGHVRKSSFRIVDWGSRASGDAFVRMGEDSLGFNTILGDYRQGRMANVEGAIRGGLDYMQVCTMSGGHQMDLRMECDWSDPTVLGGGIARAVQQAFFGRTTPNCLGVHFYDEPGLTWEGEAGPFGVTAQHRSYRSAFGRMPPAFADMKPDDPEFRAAWTQWHNWHEGFMDAAWKHSAFGVRHVRGDYLPITQSVYGFSAYADGYYFNVVRSLPLISGHGGYSDGQTGFYYPALHMEYGRLRDLQKPYWYLPSWYRMSNDQYRVEQYMSFMNNLQGAMKPPDPQVHSPATCQEAQGILEANKLQLRLGTIFESMPATRPPVALLYSMSQLLNGEMRDIVADPKNTGKWGYEGGGHSRAASLMTYVASKALHIPFFPVVEEDVLDGTLAKNHRVLVVPHVNALDAKVVSALGSFIQGGGVVLVSDESKVAIAGALKVGAPLPIERYEQTGALWQKDQKQYWIQASAGHYRKALAPFIQALGAQLQKAGIAAPMECDNPGVVVSRQAEGELEYLFAVNGCNDMDASMNTLVATEATLRLPDNGLPVYDAVRGGVAGEFVKEKGGRLAATVRLGPGAMRVFARAARPIGGVQSLPPVLFADFAAPESPLRVTLGAVLVDADRRVLSGSAPLEILVTDPLGVVRWDLYRATARGVLRLDLPLAANDPAGEWKVVVRELITGQQDATSFVFAPAASCGALAGAPDRAVLFGEDRANLFRFFKLHREVTLVAGTNDFSLAAAARLTETLLPWGVRCRTVAAADVNKPRPVPENLQRAWVGLDFGRPDWKNPAVSHVGFAVDGPVVLIGTPEDNPLLAFVEKRGFLPYKPAKDVFPGRGRGYLAWQTDAVGYFNQESVTLIAYDAEGMAEAAGTLYEVAAGIDPLMPLEPPAVAEVVPAKEAPPRVPSFELQWRALLPDRVDGVQLKGGAVTAVAHDGSVVTLDAKGALKSTKVRNDAGAQAGAMAVAPDEALLKKVATPRFVPRFTVPVDGGLTAVGYWGGLLQVVDAEGAVKKQQLLPQDIASLAAGEGQLLVGLADGQLLSVK